MSGLTGEKLESDQQFETVKKQYSTWRKCLYSAMSQLYTQPALNVHETMLGKIIFFGLNTLILWNTAAIIWTHNISISQWQDYRVLWSIFEFSRIDVICTELYSPTPCIIGAHSLLYTIFTLITIVYLSKMFFKANFKFIVYVLSIFLKLVEALDMPLFVLLSLALKYSWTHAAPSEYHQTSISMDLSTLGVLLSILSMCILTGVGYCRITFDYNCRHSHAHSSIRGKAYSRIELNSLLCNYCSIILYAFVSQTSFVAYRLAMIGIHGTIAMMYYRHLPYFNFYANFARSSCNIFACVSCSLMLIGYAVDNAVFCVYGLCLILPLTLIIWHSLMNDSAKRGSKNKIKLVEDIWEFELIIREEMINYTEDTASETIKKFQKFGLKNSCKKGKQLLLWEVAHKYYACKHEQVAFVILSTDVKVENSLEEDYQEYIIRKDISHQIYKKYGEYKFIRQINQCQVIKNKDKKACILLLEYYLKITKGKSSLDSLESEGGNLKLHLEKVKKLYSSLISEFPNSILILDLYASFILSVYNNTQEYSDLNARKKAISEIRNNAQANQNSILFEENPFFLISASDLNIGQVIFSNPSILSLLQYPTGTITNKNISHYFPKAYKFFKPKALRQFKISLSDSTTYIEESMTILDANGLLVEVSVTMILLGSINPLFLCICIPIITMRAIALISNKGLIQHHSENLMKMLEIEDVITGRNINSLIPMVDFQELKKKENLLLNIEDKSISIIYMKRKINSVLIRYLYAYSSGDMSKQEAFHHEIILNDRPIKKRSYIYNNVSTLALLEEETSPLTDILPLMGETKQETRSSSYKSFISTIEAYESSTSRSLKLLTSILFAAVSAMQIIIIVISNSINLGFLTYNINSILAQDSMNILGNAIYHLTNIGTDSPAIEALLILSPAAVPARIELLLESVTALSAIRNNFTEYNSDWGECESSRSLFEKSIPVTMMINGTNEIVYLTMADYIDRILTTVIFIQSYRFISDIDNQMYDTANDVFFLEFNGVGQASTYLKNILQEIVTCEQDQASQFSNLSTVLIFIGSAVISVCTLILIIFAYYVQGRLNSLWNRIRTVACNEKNKVSQVCSERLDFIHNYAFPLDDHYNNSAKNTTFRFNYVKRYILRVSVLAILGIIFYIVSNFVFYSSFYSLLSRKAQLLYYLALSRIHLTELDFCTLKSSTVGTYLVPEGFYPSITPISTDYFLSLNTMFYTLHNNTNKIISPYFRDLLGEETLSLFVSNCGDNVAIMNYGLAAAICNLEFDALLISYSKTNVSVDIIVNYYSNLRDLGLYNEEIFLQTNEYSKQIINTKLNQLIIFTVSFCLLLLIIYAAFYYPFFASEQKKVSNMCELAKVLTANI